MDRRNLLKAILAIPAIPVVAKAAEKTMPASYDDDDYCDDEWGGVDFSDISADPVATPVPLKGIGK